MNRYEEWIDAFLAERKGYVRGDCASATLQMARAFPELKRVAGHVRVRDRFYETIQEHFWCVDPDGQIVDPTEAQFQTVLEYIPWSPDKEVRVGRCVNCGIDIYAKVPSLDEPGHTRNFCDDPGCEVEYAAYLNDDVRRYG